MDANNLKAQISHTFEALTEQLEIINQNQGRIPQIEIDLIMENIRGLYTAFKDLDHLNNPYTRSQETTYIPPVPPPVPEQKQPEEPVVREFAFREKISMESILTEQVEPELRKTTIVQPEPAVEPVHETVTAHHQPESKPFRPSGDLFSIPPTQSISDTYKDEKKTLNDRLNADTTDKSISNRLSRNQIGDIKSAIGINEKFQFINELFAGNMQEYTTGMNQLNQFNNFTEAATFIDILKFKYNWDMNADAYRKLMEILRRRYPA